MDLRKEIWERCEKKMREKYSSHVDYDCPSKGRICIFLGETFSKEESHPLKADLQQSIDSFLLYSNSRNSVSYITIKDKTGLCNESLKEEIFNALIKFNREGLFASLWEDNSIEISFIYMMHDNMLSDDEECYFSFIDEIQNDMTFRVMNIQWNFYGILDMGGEKLRSLKENEHYGNYALKFFINKSISKRLYYIPRFIGERGYYSTARTLALMILTASLIDSGSPIYIYLFENNLLSLLMSQTAYLLIKDQEKKSDHKVKKELKREIYNEVENIVQDLKSNITIKSYKYAAFEVCNNDYFKNDKLTIDKLVEEWYARIKISINNYNFDKKNPEIIESLIKICSRIQEAKSDILSSIDEVKEETSEKLKKLREDVSSDSLNEWDAVRNYYETALGIYKEEIRLDVIARLRQSFDDSKDGCIARINEHRRRLICQLISICDGILPEIQDIDDKILIKELGQAKLLCTNEELLDLIDIAKVADKCMDNTDAVKEYHDLVKNKRGSKIKQLNNNGTVKLVLLTRNIDRYLSKDDYGKYIENNSFFPEDIRILAYL